MEILSTKRSPHPYGFNETDNWLSFQPIEVSKSLDGKNWASYYDIPGLENIFCYQADIDRANPVVNLQKFTNQNGQIIANASYDPRNITLHFYGKIHGEASGELVANQLEGFFASYGAYWIVLGTKPFKKYLVKAGQAKIVNQGSMFLLMDFTFQDINGLSQSVLPSIELSQNLGHTGLGMGITESSQMVFSFTAAKFSVFNPSDIAIDPLFHKHPLIITLKGKGTPTITNKTTSDVFKLTKAMNGTLTIQLVNPYLDGQPVGINSNHGIIKLAPGSNDFQIDGMEKGFSISFDFPFYYLT